MADAIRLTSALWIGALDSCPSCSAKNGKTAPAVVHACKDPCHRRAAGYPKGHLAPDHPHYLFLEREKNLYLNLVDSPLPLFRVESFDAFFRFMDREIAGGPVLIHCNRGESRAPSLAMVYMALRLALIPSDSHAAAADAFRRLYPAYCPGKGIEIFLKENWRMLAERFHSAGAAESDGEEIASL